MTSPAKTPIQALRRTRKILEDPERWVKGEWVKKTDTGKVCYCLDGALQAAILGASHSDAYERMGVEEAVCFPWRSLAYDIHIEATEALTKATRRTPTTFNDTAAETHEDILEAIDGAIKILQEN